ncbi:MAG: hypothetical protein AVO38_01375 [delta proteobacterium ML8_D]|nr:MAG: hypothetical protein AVO38_01375 [delta proteobacterium ML8_D]
MPGFRLNMDWFFVKLPELATRVSKGPGIFWKELSWYFGISRRSVSKANRIDEKTANSVPSPPISFE